MKKIRLCLVEIGLLGFFLLLSCSTDNENEMTENDPVQEEENVDPPDDESSSGDDNPQFSGFDLNFTTGDFWEFYWFTEEVNVAQGEASANTDNGRFRVTLAASRDIGGVEAYQVDITGDNLEAYAGPRWAYLASSNNLLLGSVDGISLDTIFNPKDGNWKGGGFFANFDADATISAVEADIENEFIATNGIGASYQDGQSICEIIADVRVCANDDSFTILVNDFFKSGIGPLGYHLTRNVFDQGGGFTTSSEFNFEIGLVATSFLADDGFVPSLPPWIEKTTLPEPFTSTTIAPWNGKLYVFGGLDTNLNSSRQIYSYDPEVDVWAQTGQTPVDMAFRFEQGNITTSIAYEAFVVGDKIYFVRTEGPLTDAILVYNPTLDSWESGPDLDANVAGKACYVTKIDDNLLLFPISANRRGEVWILNTTTNLWTDGNTSPWPHLARSSVSAHGNKVYFSGTFRSGSFEPRVRVYDFSAPTGEDGAWIDMFFTGDGRADASSQVVNDRLYVLGGDNFGPEKRNVEEYVIDEDTWKTVGSMLNARARFLSVVVNDKIYAIDLDDEGSFTVEEYDPSLDRKSQ